MHFSIFSNSLEKFTWTLSGWRSTLSILVLRILYPETAGLDDPTTPLPPLLCLRASRRKKISFTARKWTSKVNLFSEKSLQSRFWLCLPSRFGVVCLVLWFFYPKGKCRVIVRLGSHWHFASKGVVGQQGVSPFRSLLTTG